MSKLIDLSGITKSIGYKTYHSLLRFVFNKVFIDAFHSEFEVIDFTQLKQTVVELKLIPSYHSSISQRRP